MTKVQTNLELIGPVLALDLGKRSIGAAVSDELLITIKRLDPIKRSNWKQLLHDVKSLIQRFDAKTVVVGLPLRMDGTMGDAAAMASHTADKFSQSLSIPVYLQDERLTSVEARENLLAEGNKLSEVPGLVDGEAAALILRDFLNSTAERTTVIAKSSESGIHKLNQE